jgi:hypothetical protein
MNKPVTAEEWFHSYSYLFLQTDMTSLAINLLRSIQADAAAHARRQAISECAEVCEKLCHDASDFGIHSFQDTVRIAYATMAGTYRQASEAIRALLTRPEEARGGDGEKL